MVTFNKFFVIGGILSLIVIANLAFLDFKILTQKQTGKEIETQSTTLETQKPATFEQKEATTSPSKTDLTSLIDSKLAKLKEELLKTLQSPTPKPKIQTTIQQPQSQPKEIFISLGAGGSTTSTDWTDISGTTIDLDRARYPGATGFYFQANLKSDATDRTTYTRLYDVNNKVGIQGSEISYTGLTSKVIESGPLTFHFGGKLTLVVQVHSLNGNLATVDSPKIRVAY